MFLKKDIFDFDRFLCLQSKQLFNVNASSTGVSKFIPGQHETETGICCFFTKHRH